MLAEQRRLNSVDATAEALTEMFHDAAQTACLSDLSLHVF